MQVMGAPEICMGDVCPQLLGFGCIEQETVHLSPLSSFAQEAPHPVAYAGADVHVHRCIEELHRIHGVEGRAEMYEQIVGVGAGVL